MSGPRGGAVLSASQARCAGEVAGMICRARHFCRRFVEPPHLNQVWMTPPEGDDLPKCPAFWPVRERRNAHRADPHVVDRRVGPVAQPVQDLAGDLLGPHQARCTGDSFGLVCHARNHCRRFLDAPHPNQVWMIVPEPDEIWQCPAFWPVAERRRADRPVTVERRKGRRLGELAPIASDSEET